MMMEVEEDKISNLPEDILYHILSFLHIKNGACISIISKRWNYIWTTIPTLHFENNISPPISIYPRNHIRNTIRDDEFMDFVDGTLHRHNTSNIDKFSLTCNHHLIESRVRSWLSNVIRGNVKELSLDLDQGGDNPLFTPLSLFTCESLISLELNTSPSIRLPKCINFPKLKRLELSKFDCSSETWNEKLFSNSPVLEELVLKFGIFEMRNFSISIPTLQLLKIDTGENVLQDCVFKIDAPRLVSFSYWGNEAKEFVLSGFPVLVKADVCFYFHEESDIPEERRRVLFSLAHVKCLTVCDGTLQAICPRYYDSNYLPTFHNVKMLNISDELNTDKGLIALLKVAPNLESLIFEMHMEDSYDNENEGDVVDVVECGSNDECEDNYEEKDYSFLLGIVTTGCMFLHLKSVCFQVFTGNPTELMWVNLILRNAKALEMLTICYSNYSNRSINARSEEQFMLQVPSIPRASPGCVIKFR